MAVLLLPARSSVLHLARRAAATTTAAAPSTTPAAKPTHHLLASAAMAAPQALPVLPTHAAGLAAEHGPEARALQWPAGSPGAPPGLCPPSSPASLTFGGLAAAAGRVAASIRASLDASGPGPAPDPALPACGPRVGILARPGPAYAAALWGAWAAGCVAVPLHAPYPPPALAHPVRDAGCAALLVGGGCEAAGAGRAVVEAVGGDPAALPVLDLDAALLAPPPSPPTSTPPPGPPPPADTGAVLIYTSGTTGPPKGALHTGAGLAAQASSLAAAWGLGRGDVVLNALPLHHIHGLVNALIAPLAAGAAVEVAPGFSPSAVWAALTRGLPGGGAGGGAPAATTPALPPPPTVLMAVPTMYAYLLDAYDAMGPADQARARAGAARLRLAVCGSAACPAPTAARWAQLTGGGSAVLLERYGMTEAGMILGQPVQGPRVRGTVGGPMPGVGVRIVAGGAGGPVLPPQPPPTATPPSGELHVRWGGMFAGYWNRPDATAAAHTPDGWFTTGDVVAAEANGPGGATFTILGRASTDILKVGGFKVSALQVEDALLAHGGVGEAAVVGLPGGARGDAVAAAVVLRRPASADGGRAPPPSPADLSAWAAGRLPPAAVPRPADILIVESLPRNALGKVDKPALKREAFAGRACEA